MSLIFDRNKYPLEDLKKLAKEPGIVGLYAKIAVAARTNRGARLTPEQCLAIIQGDDAIATAVSQAVLDLQEKEGKW